MITTLLLPVDAFIGLHCTSNHLKDSMKRITGIKKKDLPYPTEATSNYLQVLVS